VTGIVFEDVNNNEKQDPGEPGIPNVDVVITDSNGNKLTLTTDTNGAYTAQVPVGSTVIDIVEGTLPPGYEQTVGTDPTTVIVPAGGTATDLDGYFIPTEPPTKSPTASPTASPTKSPTAAPTPTSFGKVNGIIYWDKDGNGTQDPDEPGIPGVDIGVTDTDGETQTVTTNESGEYMAMVPIGPAVIDIVDSTLPAGAEQTQGMDPTRVNVPEFGTATDIDGYKLPSGRLEGIVFDDVNGNGVKGPTEPGIGGVDVLVVDSAGISQTLTTDKDGVYATEVPAGPAVTDIVESTLPDGAVQTAGEDPSTIIVPEGGTATDIDGYQLPTDVPTKTPTRSPTVAPPISTPTAAPTPGGSGPGGGGQPTAAPTPGGGGQPTAAPTPGGGGQPTPGGGCINVDVDFETDAKGNPLAPGEYLQNEYASYGLILSASGGVGTTPRLFDSSNPGSQETCGDADLGSPNNACTPPGPGIGNGGRPNQPGANCDPLGNILIVQEKGENCPDDPMMGGKIVFEFVEPAELLIEMGFLDVSIGSAVTVYHSMQDGMEAETLFNLPRIGENGKQVLEINIVNVRKVKVVFGGGGAVTNVSFCYNPIETSSPTALPTATPPSPTPVPPTASPPTGATPTASPGVCTNYTINFDTTPDGQPIPPGTYVQNEWFGAYGIILAAGGGFGDIPRLFDTTNPIRDPDLGAPNEKCTPKGPGRGLGGEPGEPGENCNPLGNVLIIQEVNEDPSIPDDEQGGGTITFLFTRGVDYISDIGLMDIESRGEETVVIVDHEGTTSRFPVDGQGNNSVQTIDIGLSGVTKLVVEFHTSGAVIFINFCL
jgi:hypothetical protein